MRLPEHMSPTSLALWQKNPEDYYLRYLAEDRPPRMPQTQPMSVGSAFDAYVKSKLHIDLFGEAGEFDFDNIFEKQVEPHNRDFARQAGQVCMDAYVSTGAYKALRSEMVNATTDPIFEFQVKLPIGDVILLGKPDLFFHNAEGIRIIPDWKVNGFCAERTTSPKQGYICLRPGMKIHKNAQPMKWKGAMINVGCMFEDIDRTWASQLATYAWLTGEEVGSEDWVAGIEQLVCNKVISVASHRSRIGADFQKRLLAEYESAWRIIHSEWIFRDVSEEDSKGRQELLDQRAKAIREMDGMI